MHQSRQTTNSSSARLLFALKMLFSAFVLIARNTVCRAFWRHKRHELQLRCALVRSQASHVIQRLKWKPLSPFSLFIRLIATNEQMCGNKNMEKSSKKVFSGWMNSEIEVFFCSHSKRFPMAQSRQTGNQGLSRLVNAHSQLLPRIDRGETQRIPPFALLSSSEYHFLIVNHVATMQHSVV